MMTLIMKYLMMKKKANHGLRKKFQTGKYDIEFYQPLKELRQSEVVILTLEMVLDRKWGLSDKSPEDK